MKLKPKTQSLAPVKFKLNLPGALYEDLLAYTQYYEATYGQPIGHDALAVEILSQFLHADAGFKRWRAARKNDRAGKMTDPVVGQRQEEPPAQPERQPFSSIHRTGGDN